MNKKLFLKLGVLLVSLSSLSFVACGQKNNSTQSINSDNNTKQEAKQNPKETDNIEQNSKQELKSKTTETENTKQNSNQESKPKETENIKQNSKQEEKPKTTEAETMKQNSQQEEKQEYYYNLIKEAKQKQIDYINSIDDPKVKQSVQTAFSAAIFKANELTLKYPEDSDIINVSLNKLLDS